MATIRIDKNLMVPMRDGVRLATDVYQLENASPAPVLLTRTPYEKEQILAGGAGVGIDIMRAVQAGFTVVVQDVRGRFASEGEFNPHFQEGPDGADTIAWAAAQPWSACRPFRERRSSAVHSSAVRHVMRSLLSRFPNVVRTVQPDGIHAFGPDTLGAASEQRVLVRCSHVH